MLLRLIISQVCHPVFIWASEVLTSIPLPSPSFYHLLIFSSPPLFLAVSVSLSRCIAEAGVLQVELGVRSNEKLPETRHYKERGKKGAMLH